MNHITIYTVLCRWGAVPLQKKVDLKVEYIVWRSVDNHNWGESWRSVFWHISDLLQEYEDTQHKNK